MSHGSIYTLDTYRYDIFNSYVLACDIILLHAYKSNYEVVISLVAQAAAAIAGKIVKSVSTIGSVISGSLKVDAPPVIISTPTLSMDVRKTTSVSLLRQKIKSNIGSCKIDRIDVDDDSCVVAQVKQIGILTMI